MLAASWSMGLYSQKYPNKSFLTPKNHIFLNKQAKKSLHGWDYLTCLQFKVLHWSVIVLLLVQQSLKHYSVLWNFFSRNDYSIWRNLTLYLHSQTNGWMDSRSQSITMLQYLISLPKKNIESAISPQCVRLSTETSLQHVILAFFCQNEEDIRCDGER